MPKTSETLCHDRMKGSPCEKDHHNKDGHRENEDHLQDTRCMEAQHSTNDSPLFTSNSADSDQGASQMSSPNAVWRHSVGRDMTWVSSLMPERSAL